MEEAAQLIVSEGRILIAQGHMELLGLIDTIDFEQLSIEQLTYLNQLKGEILTLLGKFEDAKLAFVIAQESAIKVKNANVQAEALSALADISLKQGSLDEALIMHKDALEIFIAKKDAIGAARSFNNMGFILRRKK